MMTAPIKLDTLEDFQRECQTWHRSPAKLTDRGIGIIEDFDGPQRAAEARADREKALHPPAPTPPAPVVSAPVDAAPVAQAAEALVYVLNGEPGLVSCDMIFRMIARMAKAEGDPLRERIAALEKELAEVKGRPVLRDAGIWKSGELYPEGSIVSFQGSGWICRETHVASAEFSHTAFRLLAKKGRDAR